MKLNRRALVSAVAGWLVPDAKAQTDAPAVRALRLARIPSFSSEVNGLVLQELYCRLGIKLSLIEMPAARGTVEAKEGRVDGEVNRIRSYGDIAPTLIRVEPAFHLWSFSAWYRRGSATRVRGAADLASYSVGYLKGIKFAEDMARSLSRSVGMDSAEQLLKMLQMGRVDVVINGTSALRYEMRLLGIGDEIDSTVLAQTPLFHYLHEKHRSLVPVIGAVIKKASDSGELERIYTQFEKQLLDAVVTAKR